jgi:hypothetical protein
VALAMTQAQLRRRAEAKFGRLAERMYFTRDGLEQATRLRVAEHRAARMAQVRAAHPPLVSVVDLGCGIGGDLVAQSRAGLDVAAVDNDPLRVAVATANLAALGLHAEVRLADATSIDVSVYDLAFADPGRRGPRGRVFDPAAYEPPWWFAETLLSGRACVKVAPGIPHEIVPSGVEAEWVSDAGEVKEAALWSASLASARRRATVLSGGASGHGGPGRRDTATVTDADDPGEATVRPVGRFLHEPDGAVVRAGLVTAVAPLVGGGLLDPHIAYLTGDEPLTTALARTYEVLEHLPYREKALRTALRARGIGRLTIKKRGVNVVPDELRKRLALAGGEEATLVLTRSAAGAGGSGGRGVALLVRPMGRGAPESTREPGGVSAGEQR